MFKENDKVKILADTRQEKVEEFRERFANPYVAAERGYVDAVIKPSETRLHLIRALEMLDTKRKTPQKTRQDPAVGIRGNICRYADT